MGHLVTLTSREVQPHFHWGLTLYPSTPEAHDSGNFPTIRSVKAALLQTKFGSLFWEVEASSKFVPLLGSLPRTCGEGAASYPTITLFLGILFTPL